MSFVNLENYKLSYHKCIKKEYTPENRFVKPENEHFRNPSDNGRRSYPKLRLSIDKIAI